MSNASTYFKNDNEAELAELFVEINKILNAPDTEESADEKDSDLHQTKH